MPTEMTIEAAMIELNRLKTTERMDIDRDRMTAAIDRLVKAARKQIPQKPKHEEFKDGSGVVKCPICDTSEGVCNYEPYFCPECGQALDWSSL